MTTPSPRVYPFIPTPVKEIGLVPYQNHIKSIYGPYMGHPRCPSWTLDFSPRFLLPLEPTILFSYWSAVSHLKPHHFRLDEPAIPFFPLVSGFPLLKTRDFRFRLWRHSYIKTRLSGLSGPSLLLLQLLKMAGADRKSSWKNEIKALWRGMGGGIHHWPFVRSRANS